MNIYGYCRISTAKQSIDRQIRNIKAEYPTAHIVQEAYTGTSIFRPEWLKLYRILKAGDMVVFDSVSRMSRNAEEGFALYDDLYHKGIRLVFLKEHHIDTETYKKALSGSIAMTGTNVDFILKGINEYLMALAKEQIKLAFEQSEKEVADLHQRTREGLLTARLNGKQVGRKKGVGFETKKAREAKQIIRTHCKTFGGTLDDAECMKLTGLARNTYYKYKRQMRMPPLWKMVRSFPMEKAVSGMRRTGVTANSILSWRKSASSRILTTKMVSANRSLPGSLPPIRPTPPAIPTPAFVTAQASTRIS